MQCNSQLREEVEEEKEGTGLFGGCVELVSQLWKELLRKNCHEQMRRRTQTPCTHTPVISKRLETQINMDDFSLPPTLIQEEGALI